MRALIDYRPWVLPGFSVLPAQSRPTGRSPQSTFWEATRVLDPLTALRLTAWLFEMPRTERPWTLHQIESLVFLRALRARWPG